ncbi:hypothetical protein DICPUDRAFT_41155 [Dictyostelium purpureum]|uniref:Uncharacterized protein n=1 Tax=Dictyostelium purpureum TaxID=5786 RepID=F0ZZG5_DICPU|nr:uncharacterized protein DICPUDRAFT_41155 [Dictyostelium purpureum]EGC30667.1 hypothetical protein DICPUDRAFT_41155 [Dictyostelium purpureum]|eukprot:XP_003292816.1 hypothetical protein DICPUDRAFT_41155 [Dictyostelium purpureum]
MTVSFNTTKKSWVKKIESPNNIFASPAFVRGCFYFKDSIDINRFINAMNLSFKDYDMLLSTLAVDKDGKPLATYTQNQSQEILEIEEAPSKLIEESEIENLVPNKVITPAQQSGATGDLNGMKMGAFKLTIFGNGFSVGFNISHSMFDQTGVFYYFKYLSQIYTLGADKITLKKPEIIEYNNNDSYKFSDINEAHQYANSNLGFFYKDPSNGKAFSENISIDIEFNSNEIDQFKSTVKDQILSKNDIISAIMFKICTLNSKLKDDDVFHLRYLCNIRKFAGLGEETLGNLFKYCTIPLKVSDIREMSIIDLAKVNRKSVSEITYKQFIKALCWYKYTQDEKHINYHYFIPSIYSTKLSNWTQFSYEQIAFDNAKPYSLKPISKAGDATNFISFEINQNNEKIIQTSVAISPDSMAKVIELSNTTTLFKILN